MFNPGKIKIASALFALTLGMQAATAEPPLRFIHDDGTTYRPFQSKPAKELLNEREFQRYLAALKELKCGSADRSLKAAFTRAYPKFSELAYRPENPLDLKAPSWERYANVYFKEFGYCNAFSNFQRVSKKMRNRGMEPPKYEPYSTINKDANKSPLILRRDTAISLLISYAGGDYAPALVKMSELVRRGNLFNPGADVELYLLVRACLNGSDCVSLEPRLQELRTELADKAQGIVDKARNRHSKVDSIFRFGKPL